MKTWILILTLISDPQATTSGMVVNVQPTFARKEECLSAGNAWMRQVRGMTHYSIPAALCVEQSRP